MPSTSDSNFKTGDKIKLNGLLFSNSQTYCGRYREGPWYIYDDEIVNNRYAVTNLPSRVQKYPRSVNVSGYVNINEIEKL